MSDTPRTDAAIIERRHIHKICGCLELLELVDADVARKLERERDQLREALQSVIDWNPKPGYWERPDTVARFEADMARAREVLEETE